MPSVGVVQRSLPGDRSNIFFHKLARNIGVPNDQHFQLRTMEACAFYPSRASYELQRDELEDARRLVKLMRREVSDIDKLREEYLKLARARNDKSGKNRAGFHRECWHHYIEFTGLYEQLDSLAGWPPSPELNYATGCAELVKLKLLSPYATCASNQALRDLDYLLDNWTSAADTKQGQQAANKTLDLLILRLAECFEQLKGRRPDTGKVFLGFVEIVLNALPCSPRKIETAKERDSLKKRIERVLKSPIKPPLKRDYEF